jgi:hypothetical protein
MKIPAPVKQLNESHFLFDQSACQEAVVGKTRCPRLRTVCIQRILGFARNIHHFRDGRLHSISQLVLGNACMRFRMAQVLGLLLVQIPQGVQTDSPHVPIHPLGVRDIQHGIALGAALDTLIYGR